MAPHNINNAAVEEEAPKAKLDPRNTTTVDSMISNTNHPHLETSGMVSVFGNLKPEPSLSAEAPRDHHMEIAGATDAEISHTSLPSSLEVNGKRRFHSVSTSDPETEAGLELLFAASLIQQNDDSMQSAAKAISSGSENDSTESPLHTSMGASAPGILPREHDVLCGRGGFINKHVGNMVYRKVVDHNKGIYRRVPKRHRILVSQSIVQTIEKHGGRFLQPVNGEGDKHSWAFIPYRRAVQKTSQALREPGLSGGAVDATNNVARATPAPEVVALGSIII
jgi:hypothetical protein